MSQSLDEFLSNIGSLLAHLQYEKESQLYFRKGLKRYPGDTSFEIEFRTFVNEAAGASFLRSKIYSYQNAIISLYGYLERFIEDSVIEYLNSISIICPKYKSLPSAIRKNHLGLSLELINKIQKIKGLPAEERKVRLGSAVNNMNEFLKEESNFKINHDAFINHSSNFRYDTIHEVFSRVGIEGISRRCLKDNDFVITLCQKHNIEGSSNHKVLVSLLMTELNDLVQRRNEIAHGVRIDDIESIDMTISRINLVKAYVQAINQVVSSYFEQYTFSVSPNLFLGTADKIFPNLNVIGFMEVNLLEHSDVEPKIAVGDRLFAVNNNSSGKNISGKIISLQRDGVPQKVIALPCDKPVSIGVNFDIPTNFKKRSVYVVPHA